MEVICIYVACCVEELAGVQTVWDLTMKDHLQVEWDNGEGSGNMTNLRCEYITYIATHSSMSFHMVRHRLLK